MDSCKYYADSLRCEYCQLNDDDKLHWRSCHRVVGYPIYRVAIVVSILTSLFVSGVLGYRYGNELKQPCTEQTK